MSDQGEHGTPESHGVYGGTVREDGKMQEEPSDANESAASGGGGADEPDWADKTESGGEVT